MGLLLSIFFEETETNRSSLHRRTVIDYPSARYTLSLTQELCESRGGRPGLPSLISLQFLWTSRFHRVVRLA